MMLPLFDVEQALTDGCVEHFQVFLQKEERPEMFGISRSREAIITCLDNIN